MNGGLSLLFVFDVALVTAVLGTSPLGGAGRLLGPTGLMSLMLLSIFGIRPLIAGYQNYNLYGLDAYSGAGYASKVGAIGLGGFALGCILCRPSSTAKPAPGKALPVAMGIHPPAPGRVVWLSLLGAALTVAVLFLFGGTPAVLGFFFNGRSASLSRLLANLPTFFSMLSFLGSAAASAYIALCLQTRPGFTRRELVYLGGAVTLSFALNVSTGDRRALIPIFLVPVSTLFLARRGRLPGRLLTIGLLGVFFFATLPFVRSEGARPQSNVFSASVSYASGNGAAGLAKGYFLSYDTEMFNYVAYVGPRLGNTIPYGGGRATLGELLTFPLPARVTPDPNYSDQILTRLYGGGCGDPVCPVPSAIGVLLLDFGLLGVALGMLPIGYFYRRLERRALNTSSPRYLLFAGVLTGYSPIFIRTYSPDAVWWEIYYLAMAFFAFRLLQSSDKSAVPDPEPTLEVAG